MTNDNTVKPSILTREFNAPKKLVFEAWTQPEHLQHWMFPQKGFSCEYVTADIREGGTAHHKMISADGREMWQLTKYEEINPFDSLVFRQYNSNEAGEIVPNSKSMPHMPDWPQELRTRVELVEVDGITQLTLIWQPVSPSEQEAKTFEASRSQHVNGWGSGFEQLAEYLLKL